MPTRAIATADDGDAHTQSSPFPAHQSCVPIWVSRLLLGVSILDLLRALDTVTITTRNSTKVFTCQRAIEPNNLLESQLQQGETSLLGTQQLSVRSWAEMYHL